jgi:hypothetical protein
MSPIGSDDYEIPRPFVPWPWERDLGQQAERSMQLGPEPIDERHMSGIT